VERKPYGHVVSASTKEELHQAMRLVRENTNAAQELMHELSPPCFSLIAYHMVAFEK